MEIVKEKEEWTFYEDYVNFFAVYLEEIVRHLVVEEKEGSAISTENKIISEFINEIFSTLDESISINLST
jgi:hypothetical protein